MHRIVFLMGVLAMWLNHAMVAQSPVWDTLPIQLNQTPRFMYEDTSEGWLYIGGNFWKANGDSCNYLIRTDGEGYETPAIDSLGNHQPMPQTPLMMTSYQGKKIVGGFGGIVHGNHKNWSWVNLGNIVTWTHSHYKDNLIFGGGFSNIGGASLSSVAAWDGQTWSSLYGIDTVIGGNTICGIVEYQGDLYVGGNISPSDAQVELLRWDGQVWQEVPGAVASSMGGINCMVVFKDELYVGGIFTKSAGSPGNNIARWNGHRWEGLGEGVGIKNEGGNSVQQMFIHDGYLWVAGVFNYAGGIYTPHLARWDGDRWCKVGVSHTNVRVGSLKDTLYNTISVFNPNGPGGYYAIRKLLDPSYADTCSAPVVASVATSSPEAQVRAYPNPTSGQCWVQLDVNSTSRGQLRLLDAVGRVVRTQPVPLAEAHQPIRLDVGGLSSGFYTLQYVSHNLCLSTTLSIQQ
jgi:hypothetical protein